MNSRLVYTAIYGDYDDLGSFEKIDGVDYIAFSDRRLESDLWDVVVNPKAENPRWAAKLLKLYPPKQYKETLWIDGNVDILFDKWEDLTGAIRGNKDLAFYKHPQRDCLYQEAYVCKRTGLDDSRRIQGAEDRYRAEGVPEHCGLWAGTIIYRRNSSEVERVMQLWREEIGRGSIRDQISLPYVLRKLNYKPGLIPGNLWDNGMFNIRGPK